MVAPEGLYIIEDVAPAHWKGHLNIFPLGDFNVELFDMSSERVYDNALIKITRQKNKASITKGHAGQIKTIAITLSERPEERARLEQHLNERGVSNVHYMNGINAEVFGLKTEHTYEYDNPGTDYHIGAKDVGNVMSHYMAWTVAAALPHDLFLIVEGDVILVEDWYARIIEALNDADDVMPDWDIMYVGSCHCLGKPKTRLKGDLWDVKYPLCTHAYLLTRKAVKYLIMSQRDVYAAIDCALMQRSLPYMKVLTVLPRIADQVKWNDTSDAALKW
jgi:GR25 family glycosyltransferase involved in LPS biosynthesis